MLQNPEIAKNTKYQNNRDLRAIGKLLCFGSQIRVRVKHTPRRTCNLDKAGSASNEGVVAGSRIPVRRRRGRFWILTTSTTVTFRLVQAKNGIPIIFITADCDIPMAVRAMKAGAVEFLTEPFRDQDLLD